MRKPLLRGLRLRFLSKVLLILALGSLLTPLGSVGSSFFALAQAPSGCPTKTVNSYDLTTGVDGPGTADTNWKVKSISLTPTPQYTLPTVLQSTGFAKPPTPDYPAYTIHKWAPIDFWATPPSNGNWIFPLWPSAPTWGFYAAPAPPNAPSDSITPIMTNYTLAVNFTIPVGNAGTLDIQFAADDIARLYLDQKLIGTTPYSSASYASLTSTFMSPISDGPHVLEARLTNFGRYTGFLLTGRLCWAPNPVPEFPQLWPLIAIVVILTLALTASRKKSQNNRHFR